jgi:hypothetical protein
MDKAVHQYWHLRLQDLKKANVFGQRYRSSRYNNTASSLWPCKNIILKPK